MAAHAGAGHAQHQVKLRSGRLGSTLKVSASTPGAQFSCKLTPTEWTVARLIIEGMETSEIAQARQTTQRTIANQLASLYRKLGISGRLELRALAVTGSRNAESKHFV
jgi:DNA-binding NarL/FixJ family response regulator